MLSRREKLLIFPWQQRRYENHLRKIQLALPAIDNRPPVSRNHVAVKLKRKQNENERCTQIEKDNLILLQKLGYITKTTRINNYWETPQPNFLNRVGIYKATSKECIKTERSQDFSTKENARIRITKCLACTPQKAFKPEIPEKRIPWEPEKPQVRRIRSKSVPIQKVSSLSTVKEMSSTSPDENYNVKQNQQRSKSSKINRKRDEATKEVQDANSPHSIVLSRGSLVLAVNFPSGTFVKLKDGGNEKLIMGGLCQCKNMSKKIY